MSADEQLIPSNAKRVEWDRITAIMAVLIGACALAVSFYTAKLQSAQVRAQTWPYLQMWQSNVDRSFSISNRGVGPARIADVKLWIDDDEVANFDQAIIKLSKQSGPMSTMQSYEQFNIFYKNRKRIAFQICYCSVLDECYLLDERAKSEQEYISSVSKCPIGRAGKFR